MDPAFQDQFQRTLDVAARTGAAWTPKGAIHLWWTSRQRSPRRPTRSFHGCLGAWWRCLCGFCQLLGVAMGSLTKSRSPSALTRQKNGGGHGLAWLLGFVLFMLGPIVLSPCFPWPVGRASTSERGEFVGLEITVRFWADPTLAKPEGDRLLRGCRSPGQGFALPAAVILNAKLRGVEAFWLRGTSPTFWRAWAWRCCGHGCFDLKVA